MNILQIAPQLPYPLIDGGKIGIFNITKHLSLRGHKIYFLTFTPKQDADFTEFRKYCEPILIDKDTSNTIKGLCLNIFSKYPYNMVKYFDERLIEKIIETIDNYEIDVVHIDHLHMAYCGKYIKEKYKIPVIIREHNVEYVLMERFYQTQKNLFKKLYAWIQLKKLKKYEATITEIFDKCAMITPADEAKIKTVTPKVKTNIIPAGVDVQYFRPNNSIEKQPNRLVFTGHMGWKPNIDAVIWFCNEIFPIILDKIPTAKFYIVGRKPTKPVLNLESPNVIVTGRVEDVRPYVHASSVFVVPLRIGGGMRLKILEAMAMEIPIISTSVGCEGIAVESGKNIIIADKKQELASSVINLLHNNQQAQKLLKEGTQLIKQRYSWEKIAEQFDGIYKEVLT